VVESNSFFGDPKNQSDTHREAHYFLMRLIFLLLRFLIPLLTFMLTKIETGISNTVD